MHNNVKQGRLAEQGKTVTDKDRDMDLWSEIVISDWVLCKDLINIPMLQRAPARHYTLNPLMSMNPRWD